MEEKRNLYGYIRVSTLAQHDDRQWIAMDEFGVSREFVFADKQSGKDFNRPFRLREKSLPGCFTNLTFLEVVIWPLFARWRPAGNF